MIRRLYLTWYIRQRQYALNSCRQMIVDAQDSAEHYAAQLRRAQAELAMLEAERRWRLG